MPKPIFALNGANLSCARVREPAIHCARVRDDVRHRRKGLRPSPYIHPAYYLQGLLVDCLQGARTRASKG
jgi:hypothetical protein